MLICFLSGLAVRKGEMFMKQQNNEKLPTYKRQRFLLEFIRQLKSKITATNLQKLIFLYTRVEDSSYYDFVQYKFGAYSFQLDEDIGILQRDGYISINSDSNSRQIKALGEYTQTHNFIIPPERGDKLIRKTYLEYPYFAINSEIAMRVLDKNEYCQHILQRHKYSRANELLFTIGYEGKNIENFINILLHNDVRRLCDLRKNPLSRKFGFSKKSYNIF